MFLVIPYTKTKIDTKESVLKNHLNTTSYFYDVLLRI